MISDYNEVAWVPGQYAKGARREVTTWYPGKKLVVEPTTRAIDNAIKQQTNKVNKMADKALYYAPLLSVAVAGVALIYVIFKDRK